MTRERFDIYQAVTDQVTAALERGVVPWKKPWKNLGDGTQANVVSKRPYRGINQLLLGMSEYEQPWWLTFKQAQALGGTVRKGEKSTMVVFWKPIQVKDENSEDPDGKKTIFMLRYYRVFNVEQVDGIEDKIPSSNENTWTPIQDAQEVVGRYVTDGDGPDVRHGGDHASYSPSRDLVWMPKPEAFESREAYYAAAFHELAHSTGHKSRLDRDDLNVSAGFGSDPYAREELVAELSAAMLCATVGIDTDPIKGNRDSYIAGWLKRLADDRKLIVHAAARAQRAADWIVGESPDVVLAEAAEEVAA